MTEPRLFDRQQAMDEFDLNEEQADRLVARPTHTGHGNLPIVDEDTVNQFLAEEETRRQTELRLGDGSGWEVIE